jgi:hypothetical protein
LNDPISVALVVADALDECQVPYSVGGSLASSFSGEPRASIDVDMLVHMTAAQVGPFLDTLGDSFYADADSLRRAVEGGTSTNLIHRPSGIKIDLFVARSVLDARQLERRQRLKVESNPDRFLYVHSPEDILLQKLHWFRLGGTVSERQWRDVLSVIVVQGPRLDRDYLAAMAPVVGVADLLARAYREAMPARG